MRDNKANYHKLKIGIHLKLKKETKNPQIPKISSSSKNDAFLLKLKNINLVANYLKNSKQIQQRKIKNQNFSFSKELSSDTDKSSFSLLLNKTINTTKNETSFKKFPKQKKSIKSSFRKIEKDIFEKRSSSRIKSSNFQKITKTNKTLIIPVHPKKSNDTKNIKQPTKNDKNKINFKKHNTNNILNNLQYFNISNDDIIYEDPETTERGINNNINCNEKPISKNLSNVNLSNIKQKISKIATNRESSRKHSETEREKKRKKFNNPKFGEVEKYTKKNATFIQKNKKLDSYRLKCKIWKTKTNEDLFSTDDNTEITEIYDKNLMKNKKFDSELNNAYTNIYENYKRKNSKQRNKISNNKKNNNDIVYRTVACVNFYRQNKPDKNAINNKQKIKPKLSNNNEIKPRNKFFKCPIFSNKNRNQKQKNIRKKFCFSKSKEKNTFIEKENKKNKKKSLPKKKNASVDIQKNIKKKETTRKASNVSDIIDTIRSISNEKRKDVNIKKIQIVENNEDNINVDDILYGIEKNLDESKIDKFDELETIIRFIDFGTVSFTQIGIFSVVNNKYNNFIKEFDSRFNKSIINLKENKINREEKNKGKIMKATLNAKSERTNNSSSHKAIII